MNMNYHNITYPDMKNGDGLRVVLWLSGCSHHCYNCQNPQTWDANSGILFDDAAREELFRELDKDYISGLTLSGGDPLNESNLDGVLDLVNQIRILYGNTKTIWLYTGYEWKILQIITGTPFGYDEEIEKIIEIQEKRRKILRQCDVLVDGKYIDSQRDPSLKWRGSANQRVIDIQKSLQEGKVILWDE
jgi:anaerobic ribonucleoside-triphosphate reductase activating protein